MATIKGKLKIKGETKEFGNNGFTKREIVIETVETYPQSILIEFIKDKCSLIDGHQVGDELEVSINIQGREWVSPQGETKYFNSLQGWKIIGIAKAEDDNFPDDNPEKDPWD
jgi:hypothetical protein